MAEYRLSLDQLSMEEMKCRSSNEKDRTNTFLGRREIKIQFLIVLATCVNCALSFCR